MLKWTITFFIIAVIAAFFGYGQIEGPVANTARTLFFICAALATVAFFARKPSRQRND